jgi:hypothetical protein
MHRAIVRAEFQMTIQEIQNKLEALGVPPDRSLLCARQLDKRAEQLVAERRMNRGAAEQYLIGLLAQGWAAPKPEIP